MRRRLLILAVFFALFVVFVGLSQPAVVQAACPIGKICTPTPPAPLVSSSNGGPGTLFNDGRINNTDPWETSAIYCMGDGSVRVYVIGNPWHIAFTASPDAINNSRINLSGPGGLSGPTHGILISGNMGAHLYRLPNGMLQVISPGLNPSDGDYSVIFMECPGLRTGHASRVVELNGNRLDGIISVDFETHIGGGGSFGASASHQESRTNQSATTLTITKTISGNGDVAFIWFESVLQGKFDLKTVAIVYFNGDGKEIQRITFTNCYPVNWELSGGHGAAEGNRPSAKVQLTCLGGHPK